MLQARATSAGKMYRRDVAPTPYSELNSVLNEVLLRSQTALGESFFGMYLTGSFAIGDADLQSDCDFLVVFTGEMSSEAEVAIRALHDELPQRDGHWTRHLEGSYARRDDLMDPDAVGREWLYVDHGQRTMELSEHCNREVTRWTLRERGVVLAGPDPKAFVAATTADALRARMDAVTCTEDILSWAPPTWAWSQRYLVGAWCRLLYTLEFGSVASKRAALEWGEHTFGPQWAPLLRQAREDRIRGLDYGDPPRPGTWGTSLAFSEWCRARASSTQA